MIKVIAVIAYFFIAAVAMFFAVKWNNRFDVIGSRDTDAILVMVSVLWPIAFPMFAAYIWAHASSRSK